MKKMLAIAALAISFAACNGNENETTTTEQTSTNTETQGANNTSGGYSAADGDVTYENNKVRVRRNGEWVDADNDVTLDDGTVVTRNGRVRKGDREIELEDGQIVNRTGNFFDRTGRAIDNAWDATKEGAKDAGRAIENTAEKVGDRVEKAVDGNDRDQ